MSEEPLVFNGKKYISSRRASEISGYHIDYLGQLSRSGKIQSEMVGRTRFICEESLFTYLHALNLKTTEEVVASSAENNESKKVVLEQPQQPSSAPIASPVFSPSQNIFNQTITLSSVINFGLVERVGVVLVVAMLAIVFAMPQMRLGIVAFVESVNVGGLSARSANILRSSSLTNYNYPVVSSTGRGTLVQLDNQYFNTVHAIQNFFEKILVNAREFILNIADSVWSVFSKKEKQNVDQTVPTVFSPSASNNSDNSSEQLSNGTLSDEQIRKIFNEELDKRFSDGSAPKEGMVVVPSSGTPAGDAAIKDRIRKSFSDDVKVELDDSKTAGVVRPQFKNPTDDSYVFLLVPVNQ